MNRASHQIRSVAKQLAASETPPVASAEEAVAAAFPAIDKLRPHLSMLMGRSGFQALLARALLLASAELPWLTAVRVVTDGELEGLTAANVDAADFSEGEIVLLAQLIGLLVAFIGPALALRLINQIWPQLSFDEADFSITADSGKAK